MSYVTMTVNKNDLCDLSEINLEEISEDGQNTSKLKKEPKRILQFCDGELEQYSSEEEVDMPKETKTIIQTDPKTLDWLPWALHHTTCISTKMLNGCDYVGEWLANFFGITAPKYQFEINEYYRLQALEKEMMDKNDLEMGGWTTGNRNNLINSNDLLARESS